MFFTRIPVSLPQFETHDLNLSVQYFPLIGALVGVVGALTFWGAALVLPQALAVLLSMGATAYLTGAFHEDGLADAADGLGGGLTRERALTIMQDSRIGSYGAVTLLLVLLTKFQALDAMTQTLLPSALVAGHALSRLAALLIIHTQVYVRAEGKSKPLATATSGGQLLVGVTFGLAALLPLVCIAGWQVSLALLPPALVWLWFGRLLRRRLGGYTGDCLGAMQQLTELAFYLGVVLSLGLSG